MAYYLDLFSPETYQAFGQSDRTISGFRIRQRAAAERVRAGDRLICYMTRLSRWVGLLEVESGPFIDDTPIFYPEDDPFVVRFRVHDVVWLALDKTVPIHDDQIWNSLSFTKGQEKASSTWTGKIRGSLGRMDEDDAKFLERVMQAQASDGQRFPVDPDEFRKLASHRVRRTDKVVSVSVPEDAEASEVPPAETTTEVRESIQIQALLAQIGAQMGMSIWIPRNDRQSVLSVWQADDRPVLERLPLNYDDTTLKTIEQIDVLWLRGRSIVRAFEVEHTTSIYSGILRMADLLALQPNMDIKLHIVAPAEKRDKVFQEIRRPVFSLLDRGPLSESCTYLSYDSLRDLSEEKHLGHLSDTVLDEYAEEAE